MTWARVMLKPCRPTSSAGAQSHTAGHRGKSSRASIQAMGMASRDSSRLNVRRAEIDANVPNGWDTQYTGAASA